MRLHRTYAIASHGCTASTHRRELSDCMRGYQSCDYSKLSMSEAKSARAAEQQRNLSNCEEGWSSCDKSKLSTLEITGVADAERKRNLSHCMDGWALCDHSKLTDAEAKSVLVVEHEQNITNCKNAWSRMRAIDADSRRKPLQMLCSATNTTCQIVWKTGAHATTLSSVRPRRAK